MRSSAPPVPGQCQLSVVVAADGDARAADASIRAILTATKGLDAEVIVVRTLDAAELSEAAQRGSGDPDRTRLATVSMPAGTLTPMLWGEGYRRANGRVVAFTTTHFQVGEGWARALVAGVQRGWAGVGGNISLDHNTSVIDWAVYFLRYSAFMAETTGVTTKHEIAGDNAAYRKDVMDAHRTSFANGFWEVEYHPLLRQDGGELAFAPGADAAFVGGVRPGQLFAARFAHGRHFARWRIAAANVSRMRILCAAPLVSPILVARIARRALKHPGHRIRFLLAVPMLLWFALGWAAGELWGALVPFTAVTQCSEAAA